MDTLIFILGLIISLGFSILMLYTRKNKWFSKQLKYNVSAFLIILGIVGFSSSNTNHYRFLFFSTIIPPFYYATDRFFKYLSFKIHKRDFYLYLRWSNDINDSWVGTGQNKHIKTTDMVFSFLLLILIAGLSLIGVTFFGKMDLYSVLILNN